IAAFVPINHESKDRKTLGPSTVDAAWHSTNRAEQVAVGCESGVTALLHLWHSLYGSFAILWPDCSTHSAWLIFPFNVWIKMARSGSRGQRHCFNSFSAHHTDAATGTHDNGNRDRCGDHCRKWL